MSYQPRIRLPHTDLEVGRVGLGSSFGLDAGDLEYAFEHGINYFYWGSLRRPGFGEGVQRLAKRHRDEMVVAIQTYLRWPATVVRQSVEGGLWWLGLDYADVLILGWHNQRPMQATIDAALEMKARGRVRYLLLSSHNRPFFAEIARENLFDLFMVRYNAANSGAEKDVFPKLPKGPKRPGIIAYTATRWGTLLDPARLPPRTRLPHASDCYRFCLSHPDVNMVLSGPGSRDQVREAVLAQQRGPLDAEEMAWMRRVGDYVYGRSRVKALTD